MNSTTQNHHNHIDETAIKGRSATKSTVPKGPLSSIKNSGVVVHETSTETTMNGSKSGCSKTMGGEGAGRTNNVHQKQNQMYHYNPEQRYESLLMKQRRLVVNEDESEEQSLAFQDRSSSVLRVQMDSLWRTTSSSIVQRNYSQKRGSANAAADPSPGWCKVLNEFTFDQMLTNKRRHQHQQCSNNQRSSSSVGDQTRDQKGVTLNQNSSNNAVNLILQHQMSTHTKRNITKDFLTMFPEYTEYYECPVSNPIHQTEPKEEIVVIDSDVPSLSVTSKGKTRKQKGKNKQRKQNEKPPTPPASNMTTHGSASTNATTANGVVVTPPIIDLLDDHTTTTTTTKTQQPQPKHSQPHPQLNRSCSVGVSDAIETNHHNLDHRPNPHVATSSHATSSNTNLPAQTALSSGEHYEKQRQSQERQQLEQYQQTNVMPQHSSASATTNAFSSNGITADTTSTAYASSSFHNYPSNTTTTSHTNHTSTRNATNDAMTGAHGTTSRKRENSKNNKEARRKAAIGDFQSAYELSKGIQSNNDDYQGSDNGRNDDHHGAQGMNNSLNNNYPPSNQHQWNDHPSSSSNFMFPNTNTNTGFNYTPSPNALRTSSSSYAPPNNTNNGAYSSSHYPQQQYPQQQYPQEPHHQQQRQHHQQQPNGAAAPGLHYTNRSVPANNYPTQPAPPVVTGGPEISAGLRRKFQPPRRTVGNNNKGGGGAGGGGMSMKRPRYNHTTNNSNNNNNNEEEDELPEELQHLDKELVKKIESEILVLGDPISFDDIAGLEGAKQTIQELICWPMKRPDLFTGLRRAPNGLLLFGPPGTGKTLIGKAIANESGATFFSISSSALTSKWIGEGEKLVKTLYAVANYKEPSVVFIDEIDSLLTQRSSEENEASRRIKTEFLVQLDGTSGTSSKGRVLTIGATNRPHELDDAARRRFVKRLYIPLPVEADRKILLTKLLTKNRHALTSDEIHKLAIDTKGYSGADLSSLCQDASLGPVRQLGSKALHTKEEDLPPITYKHFKKSLRQTKPSVAQQDLEIYIQFNQTYGSKDVSTTNNSDSDSDDDGTTNNG